MKVILSTGVTLDIMAAKYASRNDAGYTDLYDKANGTWLAQVPNDAVILAKAIPDWCVDTIANMSPDKALSYLLESDNLLNAPDYKLAKLKARLCDFDGKKREWKIKR